MSSIRRPEIAPKCGAKEHHNRRKSEKVRGLNPSGLDFILSMCLAFPVLLERILCFATSKYTQENPAMAVKRKSRGLRAHWRVLSKDEHSLKTDEYEMMCVLIIKCYYQ